MLRVTPLRLVAGSKTPGNKIHLSLLVFSGLTKSITREIASFFVLYPSRPQLRTDDHCPTMLNGWLALRFGLWPPRRPSIAFSVFLTTFSV
jgi:hypothetical protein